MASLILFLRVWQPKKIWTRPRCAAGCQRLRSQAAPAVAKHSRSALIAAWTPWIILSVFVFIWGLPPVKAWLNSLFAPPFP
jgi:lactate permease